MSFLRLLCPAVSKMTLTAVDSRMLRFSLHLRLCHSQVAGPKFFHLLFIAMAPDTSCTCINPRIIACNRQDNQELHYKKPDPEGLCADAQFPKGEKCLAVHFK